MLISVTDRARPACRPHGRRHPLRPPEGKLCGVLCRRAFTLVELLVVIAIIGILVALLLPAVQAAREAARRSQCTNNLKQITLALSNYLDTHKVFPPGRMGCDGSGPCTQTYQRVGTSGLVAILPFMEQGALYDRFDFSDGPWVPTSTWLDKNAFAIGQRVETYVCPSDDSEPFSEDPDAVSQGNLAYDTKGEPAATGNYALVAGSIRTQKFDNNGVFFYCKAFQAAHIRDGLSNTLFAGEVVDTHTYNNSNIWSRALRWLDVHRSTEYPLNTLPNEGGAPSQPGAFASRHPGGANFGFGDGHVAFLSETIDTATYRALSTRKGKEAVQGP